MTPYERLELHPPELCPTCGLPQLPEQPHRHVKGGEFDPRNWPDPLTVEPAEPRLPYHGWTEPPRPTRIGHYARIAVVALVAAVVVLVAAVVVLVGLALR